MSDPQAKPMSQEMQQIISEIKEQLSTPQNGTKRSDLFYDVQEVTLDGGRQYKVLKSNDENRSNINKHFFMHSILPLQFELESHLGLIARALLGRERLVDSVFTDRVELVLQSLYTQMSVEVLRDQADLLAGIIADQDHEQSSNLTDSQRGKNTKALNSQLVNLRKRIAESYQEKLVQGLQAENLVHVQTPEDIDRLFKSTTASTSDYYIEIGDPGVVIENTQGTAHAKHIGCDPGDVYVHDSQGSGVIRIPSIVASDAKTATNEQLIADVKKKITQVIDKHVYLKQGSDPIYYNLLTFNNLGSFLPIDHNKQKKSSGIILQALHRYNKTVAKNHSTQPFVLLNNLSVNGWGADMQANESDQTIAEAYAMAQVSVHALLADCAKKNYFSNDVGESIKAKWTEMQQGYRRFLEEVGQEEPSYFHRSSFYKHHLEYGLNLESVVEEAAPTEALLAKVLLKLVAQRKNLKVGNGMLVQSISTALQNKKLVGCKSANERTMFVLARARLLKSGVVNEALRKVCNSDSHQVENSIKALSDAISVDFNKDFYHYAGPGFVVSCHDQGAAPKIGVKKGINTNNFEHQALTTHRAGQSSMQAHKLSSRIYALVQPKLYCNNTKPFYGMGSSTRQAEVLQEFQSVHKELRALIMSENSDRTDYVKIKTKLLAFMNVSYTRYVALQNRSLMPFNQRKYRQKAEQIEKIRRALVKNDFTTLIPYDSRSEMLSQIMAIREAFRRTPLVHEEEDNEGEGKAIHGRAG